METKGEAATTPPVGVVTFLFTDIEGSTELWQTRSVDMAPALARHDEIARETLAAHGGHVFGVGGDGFFAAFGSPCDALDAARTIHDELADDDLIAVRIALHTGEATVRDGAYFGLEVNRTARIASCAHGGQLVMSGATAALLDRPDVAPLGTFQLRGFDSPTAIWQHGEGAFPSLRAAGQTAGNITAHRDRLVGRSSEVEEIVGALGAHDLVTLVGVGGVGKTRLATETALDVQDRFGDGVWVASLAPVVEGNQVAGRIVSALGLHVAQGTDPGDLLERWADTKQALLVIDNCEHVADAVARLVDALLAGHPSARFLATSQVPLGVRGERVLPIGPLGSADADDGSAALFLERARNVNPHIDLETDLAAIEEICAGLDHLPLAIELAASLSAAMRPGEIAQRLSEPFRLLRNRDRLADERHQTLEAALRWSFGLLDETQQIVLRRLAVFAASFSLAQAQAVVSDDGVDEWDVMDSIVTLVERSLIVAGPYEDTTRYHLLESVKAFGRIELEIHGETQRLRDSYIDDIASTAMAAANDLLTIRDRDALDELLDIWLHIQAVLQLAADRSNDPTFERLYAALGPVWNQHGRTAEGALWAEQLLDRSAIAPAERAPALFPAIGAIGSNEAGAGEEFIRLAEKLWKEHGTEPPAYGLAARALNVHVGGDDARGCELATEALRMCQTIDEFTWNRNQAVVMALSVLSLAEQDLAVFTEMFEHERGLVADEHLWRGMNVRAAASRVVDRLEIDDPIGFVAETAHLQLTAGFHHAAAHTFEALAVQHLKVGNTVDAATAALQAVELTLSDGPAYLWVRLLHVTAVLLGPDPDNAARLLGYSYEFHRARGDGQSEYQKAAYGFFEAALGESCGRALAQFIDEGARLDRDQVLVVACDALRAVIDSAG